MAGLSPALGPQEDDAITVAHALENTKTSIPRGPMLQRCGLQRLVECGFLMQDALRVSGCRMRLVSAALVEMRSRLPLEWVKNWMTVARDTG